jgi:hypothetical protein
MRLPFVPKNYSKPSVPAHDWLQDVSIGVWSTFRRIPLLHCRKHEIAVKFDKEYIIVSNAFDLILPAALGSAQPLTEMRNNCTAGNLTAICEPIV